MKLKVIEGTKDKQFQKRKILTQKYKDLYIEKRLELKDFKQIIFYGVKYINYIKYDNLSYEELQTIYNDIQYIKLFISKITYKEFCILFPIDKFFKGEKWECKDYYSTINYLNNVNITQCISDNVDELIFQYYNVLIMNFGVKELLIIDKLRRFNNQTSVLEDFLISINADIETFTYNKKQRSLKSNKTGKIIKIKKTIPSYLRVIK